MASFFLFIKSKWKFLTLTENMKNEKQKLLRSQQFVSEDNFVVKKDIMIFTVIATEKNNAA